MDPRVVTGPQLRQANHSPLMAAKARASVGEKVNFCPFGCEKEVLDENGYCRHLIGFTNDGKFFEPMIRVRGGRRLVQVERAMEKVGEDEDGPVFAPGPPILEPVRKTDKLVQITVSSRVYRNVDKEANKAKSA